MESGGVNNLWMILSTFLVLLMQCGFLMLEGGRVRSKNSIHVAQKNASDLVVVWIAFFAVGFYLMFGVSLGGLTASEETHVSATPLSFIFQFAFACTTATIVSGAIAERVSFRAYLVLVASMTTVFYPLIGRAVWGNTYNEQVWAPLADIGFIDFAGSTVVHSTGAWFGLVALLMLGPRIGRFDKTGKPQIMAGHSSVMALFGVLLLMLGWLGFNGGTLSPSDPRLIMVLFNTLNGAAFGALAGMYTGMMLDEGLFNPGRITTGLLGGLVSCTAGIAYMDFIDAMLIGSIGGFVATYGAHILLHRWRLDDPLDVVSTHGFAGVFGTLAVAFVLPDSALLGSSRLMQFGIQLLGVGIVFIVASGGCWLTVACIKHFMQYRVSEESETIGLNFSEHGESIGLSRLQGALENNPAKGGEFSGLTLVDTGDEHYELAATLGKVIDRYEKANDEVSLANRRFQQFAETATDWLWESDEKLTICFVHANSNLAELGIDEALPGRHLLDILDPDPVTAKAVREAITQHQETLAFEAVLRPWQEAGISFDVEVRGVVYVDAAGRFKGYRGTITDITERKAAQSRALFLSRHDELTGLPNRRALSDDVESMLLSATHSGTTLVVAGVDLDGFKAVNDSFGHGFGDELLRQVAARMKSFLRKTDIAFRLGGDEFIIILTVRNVASVAPLSLAIMQRFIEKLSDVYVVEQQDIHVSASIGISVFPRHDATFQGLMRKADLALYRAKSKGKGCAVMFNDSMDPNAMGHDRSLSDGKKNGSKAA